MRDAWRIAKRENDDFYDIDKLTRVMRRFTIAGFQSNSADVKEKSKDWDIMPNTPPIKAEKKL